MEDSQTLGQRMQVTVEQGEQGTVILHRRDLPTPFTLSSDEALDLLEWLFERQDRLILSTPTGKLDDQAKEKQSP